MERYNNMIKKYSELEKCKGEIANRVNGLNALLVKQSELYLDVKKDIDNIANDIAKIQKEKVEAAKSQDGVLIDYKTFSQIVNILSFAIPYNLCDEQFVNDLINKGKNQESQKQKSVGLVKKNEALNKDNKEANNKSNDSKTDDDIELDFNEIVARAILGEFLNKLMEKNKSK